MDDDPLYTSENDAASLNSNEESDIESDQTEEIKAVVLADYAIYRPKIFGFRISALSRSGPRMSWLRWRERATEF